VLPRDVVGLPEFVVAAGLLLVLILRPSGIMGGREFAWPQRRAATESRRPALPEPPPVSAREA
jgi:hypothetical protein